MGLVAVTWLNCLRRCLPQKTRFLHTLKSHQPDQILMSPSLASLDLPDTWTPNSPCQRIPDIHKSFNEQTHTVIDGKLMASEIRSKIADQVREMKKCLGKVPGLAVILVGQRRDSLTYVHNKTIACEEVGMKSVVTELPTDCADADVQNAVMRFNKDPSIHGILVQLPLPQHLDEEKILDSLCLEKDVDGFHPLNMGNLALRGREPLFTPCTPKACIELLIRSGVKIMGKKAVVIGRSNIVGLPTSLLLQRHHATVTTVHAYTENPEQITSEADIVISAAGVPSLVRGNWIKSGATVIDVGTSPVEDPSSEDGYRLVGDVCFEEVIKVASIITPVPGGVGPMTVTMLLVNTLDSAKRRSTDRLWVWRGPAGGYSVKSAYKELLEIARLEQINPSAVKVQTRTNWLALMLLWMCSASPKTSTSIWLRVLQECIVTMSTLIRNGIHSSN